MVLDAWDFDHIAEDVYQAEYQREKREKAYKQEMYK